MKYSQELADLRYEGDGIHARLSGFTNRGDVSPESLHNARERFEVFRGAYVSSRLCLESNLTSGLH